MQAEIITIGTEILLGKVMDTNTAQIAQKLAALGLDLYCKTMVGDNEIRLTSILQQALARSDVVITNGGMGPNVDDVTRQAVAKAVGRELVLDNKLLAQIEDRLARSGFTMSEADRRQAYIPQGAIPIENPAGATPGFIVETEQHVIVSLPGVPRELEYLMEIRVVPFLREKLQMGTGVISETPLILPDMTWMEREKTSEVPGGRGTTFLGLKLTVLDSGSVVEMPLTTKKEVSLGRLDPTSGSFPDVDLTDYGGVEKGISRRHAKITKRENDIFVEDLGSINGTFLNHRKLTPYFPQALKNGDMLQLGGLVLRVSFAE